MTRPPVADIRRSPRRRQLSRQQLLLSSQPLSASASATSVAAMVPIAVSTVQSSQVTDHGKASAIANTRAIPATAIAVIPSFPSSEVNLSDFMRSTSHICPESRAERFRVRADRRSWDSASLYRQGLGCPMTRWGICEGQSGEHGVCVYPLVKRARNANSDRPDFRHSDPLMLSARQRRSPARHTAVAPESRRRFGNPCGRPSASRARSLSCHPATPGPAGTRA